MHKSAATWWVKTKYILRAYAAAYISSFPDPYSNSHLFTKSQINEIGNIISEMSRNVGICLHSYWFLNCHSFTCIRDLLTTGAAVAEKNIFRNTVKYKNRKWWLNVKLQMWVFSSCAYWPWMTLNDSKETFTITKMLWFYINGYF